MKTFTQFLAEIYKKNVRRSIQFTHKDDMGNVQTRIHSSESDSDEVASREAKSKYGHMREFKVTKIMRH